MSTLTRSAFAILVLLGIAPVLAQQPADQETSATSQPAATQVEPYWLRVTGDRVYVRSRGDQNSVAIAQLDQGSVLEGHGEQFGWHRVTPPEGAFSYISAQYVDRTGDDRGVVSVQSGGLRVRVGSLVQQLDPTKAEVQTLLERGAEVKILGQDGEWLRIAPPDGVYAYISSDFVERITAAEAGHAERTVRLTPGTTSQPAKPTPTKPAPAVAQKQPKPTTQPAQPAKPEVVAPKRSTDVSGPWGRRLVWVEDQIAAERQKPAPHDWAPLIGQLEVIAGQQTDLPVARLAKGWLARLRQLQQEEAATPRTRRGNGD